MSFRFASCAAAIGALALSACSPQPGEAGEINLFTARHYASDQAVYAAFTEETGIRVNVLEAPADQLIERLRAEGARSQADVVITVDAGRLWRAEQAGLFQPAPELAGVLENVPDNLRHPEGHWFGFASRVRVVVFSRERADGSQITDFLDLADESWRGRLCVRSSNNVYNQSLLAGLIDAAGAERAEAWAAGIAANMARAPQGGDTDQIRAVAAGECDAAIVNHYYLARLQRSGDSADRAVADAVDMAFPSLAGQGSPFNVSGAGLAANAPNRENAIAFLTFLLSETGQRQFAELTNEFPVIEGAAYDNEVLDSYPEILAVPVNVNVLGENAPAAQRMFDRVGWP
ncbi:extracellular solute-binding protein [Alkalicaulis satelles]|uniref:Extracellular solute-binding protein n=1 Tax=Alkalicaulis satelles TaxID=2609175 RepID=A0A5M6ZAZ9_9PROT|nr:extracellular solute-binding protein [Alkalicaulis satelles]KAA5801074.1 extracellular solute-binding protein [Alkalicaulis satelles]